MGRVSAYVHVVEDPGWMKSGVQDITSLPWIVPGRMHKNT